MYKSAYSGSEVSVLSTPLINKELLRPTNKTLTVASETQIEVLGKASVSFDTSQ